MTTKKYIVPILILIIFSAYSVFGQDVTPTIPPPQIVSATPRNHPTITPSLTPSPINSTPTIPPPRVVSATPDPANLRGASGMSRADEMLLSRAVDATFAHGFAFSTNAQMIIETEIDFVILHVTGNGFITGLEDPSQLKLQAILNVRVDINGVAYEFMIEERIVNGIFYARGESLDDGRQIPWFGYSFVTLIEELIGGFDLYGLPGFGTVTVGEAQEIEAFINLLNIETFISTRRVDSGRSSEAFFITEFDIESLLDSPDMLGIVIEMLAASGGIQLADRDVRSVSNSFSVIRSMIVPNASWIFERFVNIDSQMLTRAEFDFDLELNVPTGRSLDTTPINITVDAIFALSGYGENYNVEIPPDAIIVDRLEELETLDLLVPER